MGEKVRALLLFGVAVVLCVMSARRPAYGEPKGDAKAIIDRILDRIPCCEGDDAWYIAHYMLASGSDGVIRTRKGLEPIVQYLCERATGSDGMTLFKIRESGARFPLTEKSPSQRYQDHPNQMLAMMFIASKDTTDCTGPFPGISSEIWTTIVKGSWEDYDPRAENSWTLVCYLHLYDSPLMDTHRAELRMRIGEIVNALATAPDYSKLACGGAHALFALANYVKSSLSSELPKELKEISDRRLHRSALDILRWCEIVPDPGSTSRIHIDEMERNISILGHGLEWIALYESPNDTRCREEVLRVADKLEKLLDPLCKIDVRDRGGVMHAVHGLRIFLDEQ